MDTSDRSDTQHAILKLPHDVLSRWAPVLHLHHTDYFLPVAFEFFLRNGSLRKHVEDVNNDRGVTTLLPVGQVSEELLLSAQQQHGRQCLSVHLESQHWHGCEPAALNDVPLYAYAKAVLDDDGQVEAFEINYVTLYAYNGPHNLGGLGIVYAGSHVGDIEHITVRLGPDAQTLQGVWYNSHRNIEGEWCPAADVPRTAEGRIIGYVAHHGHGVYPKIGTIHRLFCIANDHTSDKGLVWRASKVLRLCHMEALGGAASGQCPCVPTRGCSLPPAPATMHRTHTSRHTTRAASLPQTAQPQQPGQPPSALVAAAASANASYGGGSIHATPGVVSTVADSNPHIDSSISVQAPESAASASTAISAAAVTTADIHTPLLAAASNTTSTPLVPHQQQQGSEKVACKPGPTNSAAASSLHGSTASAAVAGAELLAAGAARHDPSLPVVLEDWSQWQLYQGFWGTAPSISCQAWFANAEPPVSRGMIKRVCLPLAKGVERLPAPLRKAAAEAGLDAQGALSSRSSKLAGLFCGRS